MGEIVTCLCCGWTYDRDEEGPECPSCGRMFIDRFERSCISTRASYRPATEKEKKRFRESVGFWLDTRTGEIIMDDGSHTPPQDEFEQDSELRREEDVWEEPESWEEYEFWQEQAFSQGSEPPIWQEPKPLHVFACDSCHSIFESSKRPRRCPECGKKKIKNRKAVRLATQDELKQYDNLFNTPLTQERAEQSPYLKQVFYKNTVAVKTPVIEDPTANNTHKCGTKAECAFCHHAPVCSFPAI